MANTLMNHEQFDEFCRKSASDLRVAYWTAKQRAESGLFIADQMDWEREEFDDVA